MPNIMLTCCAELNLPRDRLPHVFVRAVVFRGVARDVVAESAGALCEGRHMVWWTVSSTTASIATLESPDFCGKVRVRAHWKTRVQGDCGDQKWITRHK